jgi:hypothetical protein
MDFLEGALVISLCRGILQHKYNMIIAWVLREVLGLLGRYEHGVPVISGKREPAKD